MADIEYTGLSEQQIKKLLRDTERMAKLEAQTNNPNIKNELFGKELGDGFSKNNTYVFFKQKQIDGVDAHNFEYLGYGYGKDKDSVYFGLNRVEVGIKYSKDVDAKSFKVYKGGLAMDDNYIFIEGMVAVTNNIGYVPVDAQLIKAAFEGEYIKEVLN